MYFQTKGLPGLNAAQRVGQEIEAYVQSTYGGGRGLLYRREPAVLCFKEDFFVAVPLASRPAGTAGEHTTLLRMQLVARPDVAATAGTPITATSDDWIVANRHVIAPPRKYDWEIRKSTGVTLGTPITSVHPLRQRLARLTQRPGAACPLANPLDVIGTALIAKPQGDTDPDDPTRELWTAGATYTASVRMEGAPFVQRLTFEDADLTAFDLAVDTGPGDASAWKADQGAISTGTGTARRFAIFGDGDWNHVSIAVSVVSGNAAGVAIALPAAGAPSEGLFALIEATAGGRRIALYSRSTGAGMTELAQAALPSADPNMPTALLVMAFDDRIRATVGDVSIEAARDERREGRVALVACWRRHVHEPERRRRALRVPVHHQPLALVQGARAQLAGHDRQARARRARAGDYDQHGRRPVGRDAGDATAAMASAASADARDAVFGRWIRDLGLPLKDEVSRLEVSAFQVGGHTACLLLESPEPIDFTSEVTAVLERRVFTHGVGLGDIVVSGTQVVRAPRPVPLTFAPS